MRKLIGVLLIAGAVAGAYLLGRKHSAPPAAKEERKVLYWYDPMHPAYRSDKPGVAPDCGMDLVPMYAGGPGAAGEAPAASAPPAPGTIQVGPDKQQWIGVRIAEAGHAAEVQTVRANGKVAIAETRLSRVQARAEGWIDQVMVNFTSDRVRQGQPMLTIYSPELVASEQEYLLALKARGILRGTGEADALVEASRHRLEHWNLTPEQIAEVERTGKPIRAVTLYAPASGYVTARNAFPNQRVTPDTELYTIADLDRVWILADVFESDAALIRVGQAARISLPYLGGQARQARVTYILPQIDPQTRTLKVRLEADNPETLLKPEMFVDVEFRVPLAAALSVPAGAVLDTGLSKTVFVAQGNGVFEPRKVETGRRLGERIEILSGLRAGERVAASGAFLLDSESQMKAPASGGHAHD
jgi:hypothetical protein